MNNNGEIALSFLGIIVYIALTLLPYYIAYLIISPSSFFGIVGVFILGSVIVPLSLFVASILLSILK